MSGATGPHPQIEQLPTFALIIRAQTMKDPAAVDQALVEIHARGCWMPKDFYKERKAA